MGDMNDFLMHYGTKGQKWGVRRFQNEDGTLTQEGRDRYGIGEERQPGPPDKTEYLTTTKGKKIAVDPFGMYRTMKTGRQVGKYIKEEGFSAKENAKFYKSNHYKDEAKRMNQVYKEHKAIAKKYSRMKYKDIPWSELKKDMDNVTQKEMDILDEWNRKNRHLL